MKIISFIQHLGNYKAIVGTTGVGAIEIVNQIPVPNSNNTLEIGKLIIQAVIAVVTIFKLLKRPKTDENNENNNN